MRPVVPMLDPGVVSGRDVLRTELARVAAPRPELDEVVTGGAWIGRSPERVLTCEALDDGRSKRLFEVQDVMGDPQNRRAPPRIVEIIAAATGFRVRRTGRGVHFHGDADHVVARLRQQRGGDGGVDAPAHCGDHSYLR